MPDRQTSSDYIYDAPIFSKSAKGRSLDFAHRKSSAEIKHLHGDYIQHTHGNRISTSTSHSQKKYENGTFRLKRKGRRPKTAPGLIETTPFGKTNQLQYDKSNMEADRSMMGITPDTGYDSLSRASPTDSETPEMDSSRKSSPMSFQDMHFSSSSRRRLVPYATDQEFVNLPENSLSAKQIYTSSNKDGVYYRPADISSNPNNKFQKQNLFDATKENNNKNNGNEIRVDGKTVNDFVPYMEHTAPKTIQMGNIGKVSVLESILESRLIEDSLCNFKDDTNSSQPVHQVVSAFDDAKENMEETYTISLKPTLYAKKQKYKPLFSDSPYHIGYISYISLATRNHHKSRPGIRAREKKSDSFGKVIPVPESKSVMSDDKNEDFHENTNQMKDLSVDNYEDVNENKKQNNDLSRQVTVSKKKACHRKIERLLNRVDGGLSNKAIWKTSLTRSIKSH